MTRREREITNEQELRDILDTGKVVHLGLTDGDWPYVVPMNYGYTWEDGALTLYVHGARQGYKYEVLSKNPHVSFEISCDVVPFSGDVACRYGTSYRSVMGRGEAALVVDPAEKMRALTCLMKTQTGKAFDFTEKLVSVVNVVRIRVVSFTGKKRPLPEQL